MFVYWGPGDGGTNPAAWANRAAAGAFTNLATNLQWTETLPLTGTWFYAWRATNRFDDRWGQPSMSIDNAKAAAVDNGTGGTVNPADNKAMLTGTLKHNPADVTLYWGPSDGGTNPAAWLHTASLGLRNPGPFSTTVNGTFYYGEVYYYRTYASNALATCWASSSTNFARPRPAGPKQMTVRFCGYEREERLLDFPALVELGPSVNHFSYAEFLHPGGFDLRVCDETGTRELNYEIALWDTNGTSLVWVQVPELTNGTVIRLHWGDPSTAAQPTYTTNGATWSNGYVGVWHLDEASGPIHDSTGNASPGIPMGNPIRGIEGRTGRADEYDNNGDYFAIPDFHAANDSSQLTVTAWSYLERTGPLS
ncbi:MAG: DUF2341 domain-containing protein, partial [Verrucomicrobiota bacterium]